jgi:hypothetical protein
VRIVDTLLGRTKPAQANLDALFALPSAAVTLQAEAGFELSGQAGVCFKPASGQPFAETQTEIVQLLGSSGDSSPVRQEEDSYGYRWLVIEDRSPESLVTQVHMVNTTLEEHGYGPQLLASVFGLTETGGSGAYLVYLYKRGTFYPFVPAGGERRDNEAELRIKAIVANDLKIEQDLTRWFPLWGLPVH